MFTQKGDDVFIPIFAQPKSSKSEIVGFHGDELKVKLKAPPVDGEANSELIRFMSKLLKIPQKNISLHRGDTSRHKMLKISGISTETLEATLKKYLEKE